jgi:plastocyanin
MSRVNRQTVREIAAAAAILLAVAGCSSSGVDSFEQVDASADSIADYEYVIPIGAGLALDAGSPLAILPGDFDARVGQTIQIINEDDRGHLVGPWFVGAGETMRQTFKTPGEFIGECTVHPSGQIVVTISA